MDMKNRQLKLKHSKARTLACLPLTVLRCPLWKSSHAAAKPVVRGGIVGAGATEAWVCCPVEPKVVFRKYTPAGAPKLTNVGETVVMENPIPVLLPPSACAARAVVASHVHVLGFLACSISVESQQVESCEVGAHVVSVVDAVRGKTARDAPVGTLRPQRFHPVERESVSGPVRSGLVDRRIVVQRGGSELWHGPVFEALRHDQGPHPTRLGREVAGDVEGAAVVVIDRILARNSLAVFPVVNTSWRECTRRCLDSFVG